LDGDLDILDEGEAQTPFFVCNGIDGEKGDTGAQGEQGVAGNDAHCYANEAPVVELTFGDAEKYLKDRAYNLKIDANDPEGDAIQIKFAGVGAEIKSEGVDYTVAPKMIGGPFMFTATISDGCNIVVKDFVMSEVIESSSITYNKNGEDEVTGETPVDKNIYYAEDEKLNLAGKGTLKKEGYCLTSWNTKTDGTGDRYELESEFTMGTEDVLLYAEWDLDLWLSDWTSAVTGGNGAFVASQSAVPCGKTLTLKYSNNGGVSDGVPEQIWTYKTVADKTETIAIEWKYEGSHAWSSAYATLQFFTGSNAPVNLVPKTPVNGNFSFYSSLSIPIQVTAGEEYGFIVKGENFDYNSYLSGKVEIVKKSAGL